MKPLVYLAGPYTRPDPVSNTHNAIRVADQILDRGLVVPLVPHLTLLWDMVSPKSVDHWYRYDLELLARCDALLRLPGESVGADMECSFAKKHEIPVFDSLVILHNWAATRKLVANA